MQSSLDALVLQTLVQDLPSIVSTPDGAREEQVTTVDKYA